MTKGKLGRERISSAMADPPSLKEVKTGTDVETGGRLLPGSLLMALSACLLCMDSGLGRPTSLAMKEMPHRHGHRPSWSERFFN